MKRFMLVTLFVLAACGSEKKAEEEGVFDPLVNTIDKAEAVEDAALKHKEEMDKRLKEMEGTDGGEEQ
ncbi:MAG: hypothetical protein KJO31_04830 [Gammaproteobacteria bacterium]|nr:hypothetical protein [Gammaproteobacteria bacterium]